MVLTTKTNVPRNSARNSLKIPCLITQCFLMLLLCRRHLLSKLWKVEQCEPLESRTMASDLLLQPHDHSTLITEPFVQLSHIHHGFSSAAAHQVSPQTEGREISRKVKHKTNSCMNEWGGCVLIPLFTALWFFSLQEVNSHQQIT